MNLSITKKELQALLKLLNSYGKEDLANFYDKCCKLAGKNKIIDDDASSDEDQSGDLFPDFSSPSKDGDSEQKT